MRTSGPTGSRRTWRICSSCRIKWSNTTLFEYIYAPRADTDYDAAILGLVDRAIAFDRGNLHAYRTKGQYLAISGRPKDAVRALDAGLAIDPNAAGLLATRSTADDYSGRFEQAKSDIQQAMLLSPRDPAMSQWHTLRADPELGLGRFDEALEDVKKAVDGGYRTFYAYINLATMLRLYRESRPAEILPITDAVGARPNPLSPGSDMDLARAQTDVLLAVAAAR